MHWIQSQCPWHCLAARYKRCLVCACAYKYIRYACIFVCPLYFRCLPHFHFSSFSKMGNLWAHSVGENGKMGRKQSGQALGARLRGFQIHRINSLNVQKLIACKMCTHLAKRVCGMGVLGVGVSAWVCEFRAHVSPMRLAFFTLHSDRWGHWGLCFLPTRRFMQFKLISVIILVAHLNGFIQNTPAQRVKPIGRVGGVRSGSA